MAASAGGVVGVHRVGRIVAAVDNSILDDEADNEREVFGPGSTVGQRHGDQRRE